MDHRRFAGCVCIYAHMWGVFVCTLEYMNMFICADTHEGQKFIPGYLPQLLFNLTFWSRVSHWPWSSWFWLVWLASGPLKSTCLHDPLKAGVSSKQRTWLLHGCWKSELKLSWGFNPLHWVPRLQDHFHHFSTFMLCISLTNFIKMFSSLLCCRMDLSHTILIRFLK